MPRNLARLAAAALLWGAALAPARAQTTSPATMPPPAPATRDTGGETTGLPAMPPGPLLDTPVGRSTYPLGPGDVLSVAVFGDFSHVYLVPVTPEGTVVIPEMGIARVLGLNLDQAQERVRQVVARLYRGVDVTVTLSRIRSFKVFVVGDVRSPGVRTANAAMRVSEVVGEAVSGRTWRRNLLLRRAGGDSVRVDITRFMLLGDASANPTLREGDAVMVPPPDLRVDTYGGLRFTGAFEYRPGETLAEFLTVANAGGGFPSTSADTVLLTRFVDGGARREYRFSQAEAMGERGRAFVLQPFDALFTATVSNFRQQVTAEVTGEVMHPGVYPVRSDTTTVRELVAMAGGFTPRASLTQARLLRQPPPLNRAEAELRTIPPEQLTAQERQILQVRALSDANSVVIDFRQLFAEGGDAYRQTVHEGDKLEVPDRRSEVVVLGAVREPGILNYLPGQSVGSYVARAGGATRRADLPRAMVIRARTGSRERAIDVERVDEGDTVILPYRTDADWTRILQTTGTVVGTITGLIISAVAIFR
ncbi:MAG TPA: SLBB domain-containing protein [Longimicrobium sp.]|nr:SLBB domain-containing protein [Longimicrobium sp.]